MSKVSTGRWLIKRLLFLLFLFSSLVNASIVERLISYKDQELPFDQFPCANVQDYMLMKKAFHIDDSGLEGQLCGDHSRKEGFGRALNLVGQELKYAIKAIENDPAKALSEPHPYIVYQNLPCIDEAEYQRLKGILSFDDSKLSGELCDNSLKSKWGRLLQYFIKVTPYYYNMFSMKVYKTCLKKPYNHLVEELPQKFVYGGSQLPLQNAPKKVGATSYENLPCITPDLYQEIKKGLKMDDSKLEGELCGDGSNKERIGKLLLYLKNLAVSLPASWQGGAREAIENPLHFIATSIQDKLRFSTQAHAGVASNHYGIMTLYQRFFKYAPLEAISVLIHESRHSSSKDPGHVRCTIGDRPQAVGACDQWLSTGEDAGAYSYNVSFNYGLAQYGLESQVSKEDRANLRADALSYLSRRFNSIPESLALPFETLHVLDQRGNYYYIHPILKKLVFVRHDDIDGRFTEIKFDRSNNGLLFFTDIGAVYQQDSWGENFRRYDEHIIDLGQKVRSLERMTYLLGKGTKDDITETTTYFVTEENQIKQRVFDNENYYYVSAPANFHYGKGQIVKLVQGNIDKRYALTSTGLLLRFLDEKQTEMGKENLVVDSFQDPRGKGWRDLTGGLLLDKLIGINLDGEVYLDSPQGALKLDWGADVRQYFETTNFIMIRRGDDSFAIKHYGEKKDWQVGLDFLKNKSQYTKTEINSVAFSRYYKPMDVYKHVEEISSDFIRECQITKRAVDPWNGKGMGINSAGELVFEGDRFNRCLKYEVHGSIDVTDFRFTGTAVKESGAFSRVALEILSEGRWKRIYPYDWRLFGVDLNQ